eukprot:10868109-Lingulodinium_polyedra.AAC.1
MPTACRSHGRARGADLRRRPPSAAPAARAARWPCRNARARPRRGGRHVLWHGAALSSSAR